jgi:hypothetical protein
MNGKLATPRLLPKRIWWDGSGQCHAVNSPFWILLPLFLPGQDMSTHCGSQFSARKLPRGILINGGDLKVQDGAGSGIGDE